jgi:hypothetical protein
MRNSSAIKPDEKVEVVVPVAVIEYVPNRISFLGHMKCKPDGQIIIMKLDGERVLNKSAGLLGKLGFLGLNRYQYPRHLPTSLGTAFQILLEKAHRCNYGA